MAALSQAVTLAYNEVIKDKNKPANQWAENSLLAAFEKAGGIDRRDGGNQVEVTLDININAGADILATDVTAVSESITEVLGAGVYEWRAVVTPINWTIAQEARVNSDANVKVPFLKSLAENAINSNDQVIEVALFAGSATDGMESLATLFPTTGQPNVGGIDGSSATYWRNYADTYQADGSDILLAMDLAFTAAAKGSGGSEPNLIASGKDGYAIYMSQLQPLQRFNGGKSASGGFENLMVHGAPFVFSQHGGTNIYLLNTRYTKLAVNKKAFRQLLPEVRMTAAAMYQKLVFSHAAFITSAPSRNAVLSQA